MIYSSAGIMLATVGAYPGWSLGRDSRRVRTMSFLKQLVFSTQNRLPQYKVRQVHLLLAQCQGSTTQTWATSLLQMGFYEFKVSCHHSASLSSVLQSSLAGLTHAYMSGICVWPTANPYSPQPPTACFHRCIHSCWSMFYPSPAPLFQPACQKEREELCHIRLTALFLILKK